MISKEQYEILDQYGSMLWTAHHASYVRAAKSSDLAQLRQVWEEVNGRPFDGSMNCNSCVVRLCKALYNYHREYQDNIQAEPSPEQSGATGNTDPDKGTKVVKTTVKGTLKPSVKKNNNSKK